MGVIGIALLGLLKKSVEPSFVPQLMTLLIEDISCDDPMRLMPLCERCIPGLVMNKEAKTCDFSIKTRGRGMCDIYKYLSTETLREHHMFAAKYLDDIQAKRILDIGTCTNQIHTFMTECPDVVFALEHGELSHNGSLPYSSKEVTCTTSNHIHKRVIRNVLPISIKSFIKERHSKQHFDAVVCMGCDTTYGPTWAEIMVLPRPFHLILDSSILAFQKHYPTTNEDGCNVVSTEEFDFSECDDCGYEDSTQESKYGKRRKVSIFECLQNVQQNINQRKEEGMRSLDQYCRPQPHPATYLGMACLGEEYLLSSPNINDTSLMALNARETMEEEETELLRKVMRKGKMYGGGECFEIRDAQLARTWWDTHTDSKRLEKAMSYLSMAKSNNYNIFDLLCFAGSARTLLSAAEPQEMIIYLLYDSIRTYQTLFHQAISYEEAASEHDKFLQYRFPIKECPPHLDTGEYANEVIELEPIILGGRNLDYQQFGAITSFNAYRPLASFESVKQRNYRKKILVDVGANGFAASPKQLSDNYAALGMQFDELVIFEPDDIGMHKIPDIYSQNMKIIWNKQYVDLVTRNKETDIISWLEANVHKDDFVVLKFDVDEDMYLKGPTMEWAFLGDLIYSKSISLVDEFYIELHFRDIGLKWHHNTHSSRQQYDVVRQLRACGMAIHNWP